MIKNIRKNTICSVIVILIAITMVLLLFKLSFSKTSNIYKNSKKYDLINNYDELNNYQLLLYNNERIYFYDKGTKKLLDDNSQVARKIWYGHNGCETYEKTNGDNVKCEVTLDFFELFVYDTTELLVVDKDGYIFHREIEDDFEKKSGKYRFYGNYWYGNIKLYKEGTNNETYIQEVYNSEGGSIMNVIHKDETGKLNKLYEIVDFYFYEDKYIELTENKINIFKDRKLIKENDKYDRVYDIYEGKYILIKDNNHLKIIDLNDKILIDFGEDKDNLTQAEIIEEDDALYIYEISDYDYYYELFKFDMLGNIEYLGDK